MKDLSPFAQAALDLDTDFGELERLHVEIDALDFSSDYGMERARKLLARFGACGERVGSRVQVLAQELEKSRTRAEAAAAAVSAKANKIQSRQETETSLLERFQHLGAKAKDLAGEMGTISPDDREKWMASVPGIDARLLELVTDAQKLREDSRGANMKALAENAQALGKNLQEARRRLESLGQIEQ